MHQGLQALTPPVPQSAKLPFKRSLSKLRANCQPARNRASPAFFLTFVLASLFSSTSVEALAEEPQLRVITQRELSFGSFAVLGNGYREVSPTGGVHDAGTASVGGHGATPARITVRYDRGAEDRTPIDLRIQLVFSAPDALPMGGLTARLSRYQSDLPGALYISKGQPVQADILNCTTRICEKTFHLGARLDVEQQARGAIVTIPISVDATLISIE